MAVDTCLNIQTYSKHKALKNVLDKTAAQLESNRTDLKHAKIETNEKQEK